MNTYELAIKGDFMEMPEAIEEVMKQGKKNLFTIIDQNWIQLGDTDVQSYSAQVQSSGDTSAVEKFAESLNSKYPALDVMLVVV
jgi:hypothetical protein